jgi:predicted porin
MKSQPLLKTAVAAALCAVAGAAAAQSNVTLSGIADAATRMVRNEGAGSIKSLISGGNATSRLVFRGTENLGGGMKAGFHLEHGIALDTGAQASSTQFWDRRATLSLASSGVGEIRAGRDYVPTYTVWVKQDPFSHVGVAGSTNLYTATPTGPIRSAFGSNPNTLVRSSNSVQLLLPDGLGGFEGGIMLAAAEGGTQAQGAHKLMAARLGYVAGPVSAALAYAKSKNDVTAATGDFTDTLVGGGYDFGVVRVSLTQRRFKQANASQTLRMLGAWVPLGNGELKFQWLTSNMNGRVGTANIGANDARQLGLGYVYNLSKRTALYAQLARIDNDGAATYTVPGGPAGLLGGRSSSGTELGIRHNF